MSRVTEYLDLIATMGDLVETGKEATDGGLLGVLDALWWGMTDDERETVERELRRGESLKPVVINTPISLPDAPVVPRCEGDHFFENICNACDAAQPDGMCEICPHIGSREQCRSEHFSRRPCRACGSPDMRSVRVRAAIGGV